MERSIKKGIKNLKVIKKKAQVYSKEVYNGIARPLARNFRAKIARVYLKRAYKNGVNAFNIATKEGEKFIQYAGKIYRINERKFRRSSLYKNSSRSIARARKFVMNRFPKTKRTIARFAILKYARAEKFVNKTYPKVEKFVNQRYPVVRKWVITQLPKVQAFLAGQLSARVQRIAA
jgi:hypothetical protein